MGQLGGGAQKLNGEWDRLLFALRLDSSRGGQIMIRQMSAANVEIYNL